jgi:hypothetical protein
MKKIYNLFAVLVLAFTAHAQTVSIINNTGTSPNIVVGGSNYHASESIYTDAEIGSGNFITAGSAIEKVNFFMNVEGASPNISNFRIWMKNVPLGTTTFTSGTYTTGTYTQVYNGTFNATPAGIVGVTLTTPFVRTPNTNLQVLIERRDNVVHTGANFFSAVGNNESITANSSRRYNGTLIPTTSSTTLTATTFRPAIQFVHVFPDDAAVNSISSIFVSCYDSPQTLDVEISNDGLNTIPAGAASVLLKIGGANIFSATRTNAASIAPGATETISFTGINLNNPGDNIDTAIVTLAGDGTTYNDTSFNVTTTATTLSSYPIIEDAETTLPVFGYAQLVSGADQLWTLQTGKYGNPDQLDSLAPRAPGETYFLFDSYSGTGSVGFTSRLFSNCITLPSPLPPNPAPVTTVSFWMSRDAVFPTTLDSLYLSISTDKGQTWTRLAGFQRADPTATLPFWKNEIVDISAYNGQTVQLAFEGVSQYGNIIALDDIVINYSGLAPISLLNFDAKRNGAVNNLNWTTSQEINSNRFMVERSNDGLNFTAIGTVNASGNSNSEKNYRYIDAAPSKGINYYRLRMIDNDNAYRFSAIKNVRNLGMADMQINPNPVNEQMTVAIEAEASEKATIVITDLSGKRVYNGAAAVASGLNNVRIPVNNLAKGTYVVRVMLNGQTMIKKINKL